MGKAENRKNRNYWRNWNNQQNRNYQRNQKNWRIGKIGTCTNLDYGLGMTL